MYVSHLDQPSSGLEARQSFRTTCPSGYYRSGNSCYRRRTAWSSWARWLVLGLIIAFALFVFFVFACISSRRRRRAGRNPFYGTGWAAGKVGQQNNAAYYNNNADQTAAPPYTSAPTNNGYYGQPPQNQGYYGGQQGANQGSNQGYYGQQQSGVELQSPQPAYNNYNNARGDTNEYAPPAGPPPNKA